MVKELACKLTDMQLRKLLRANDVIHGDEMSDYDARTTVPDFLTSNGFGPVQSPKIPGGNN
jgi:hypothetical protein